MDINERFEIFQKLDSLFPYSDILPVEFQEKYMEDLNSLKKKISEHKCSAKDMPVPASNSKTVVEEIKNQENVSSLENKDQNVLMPLKPALKTGPLTPPPPPPLRPLSQGFSNTAGFVSYKKNITESTDNDSNIALISEPKPIEKINNTPKKSNFEVITGALIPKLTEEGKKMMMDLSFPIESYLALKIIDDKSSLFQLFNLHNKNHNSNFLEFANKLYGLEIDKLLNFTKTESIIKDGGLIKLEELLVGGKVVSEFVISNAIAHQKKTGAMFISKALSELKQISDEHLTLSLRIQKWVSKMAERSTYQKPEPEESLPEITQVIKKDIPPQLPIPGNTPQKPLIPGIVQTVPIQPEIVHSEEEIFSKILDYIIPVLNEKGSTILTNPDYKELANRISIIDGKLSIMDIFNQYRESFKGSKFTFLKFILKLDSQEILVYKKSNRIQERFVHVKFGELLLSLNLINNANLEKALEVKKQSEKYIGEILADLNLIDSDSLKEYLKIQEWFNSVLANVSYESAYLDAIQDVLKETFNCLVDIGSLRKVSFQEPLKDIVYINYPLNGELSGHVYYISDRAFMHKLSNILMASTGTVTEEFDESYVAVVCSVIITNSLSKLSQMGLFSSSEIPQIIMNKKVLMEREIIVADQKTISLIPLINDWGRFAIGLDLN